MFGKLGELGAMLQQLQQAQSKFRKMQEDLAQAEATGHSRDNLVTAVVGGDFTVRRITIAPEACRQGDPDVLAELVGEAVNAAIGQIRQLAQERLREATGGLDLPGLN